MSRCGHLYINTRLIAIGDANQGDKLDYEADLHMLGPSRRASHNNGCSSLQAKPCILHVNLRLRHCWTNKEPDLKERCQSKSTPVCRRCLMQGA